MHKNISPEEKLLSIIKGKQNPPESAAPKPETKDALPFPRIPWNKIDGYISAALKNDFFKNSILDAQTFRVFNKCAVIITFIVAGYIMLDMILVSPSRKAASLIAKARHSGALTEPAGKAMPIETKGYSYYSNKMSGKNIFGPGSNIQTESTVPSAELSDNSLGLVGIIPGDSPQAIVEDKKNQKTYYLVEGQSINGITVEDINEDKAILEYRGKKITLFL